MIRVLVARYGHRGVWLISLGVIWCLIGFGTLIGPIDPRPWVLIELAPQWVVAGAWWLSGVVAIVAGFRGRGVDDSVGHVALYVMPFLRVFSFAASWLLWLGTAVLNHFDLVENTLGWRDGWFAALVWAAFSMFLALGAAWPNPEAPLPAPPTGMVRDGD